MSGCFLCGVESSLCTVCNCVQACEQHYSVHKPSGSSCRKFRVEIQEGKGRTLVATQQIKAGEVVLVDTPLVQGPGNKTPPTCLDCLSPWKEADGATCTLCKWPVCGETCQSGLWHSIECSTLSRLKTVPVFSSDVCPEFAGIFSLRISLLAKDPTKRDQLDFLMDHADDIIKDSNFELNWGPGLELISQVDDLPYSGVRGVGIFCTNAVSMPHRNGRWIFPTFSFLSHSCVSNSRFFLHQGEKVLVRAQVDIQPGEEITISYMEPGVGGVLRRRYIQELWYFCCTCPLCSDPTELGTYLSGVKCRECSDYLLPKDSLDNSFSWICSGCKAEKDGNTMHALASALNTKSKSVEGRDETENMIETLLSILHPNHFILLYLKEKWLKFDCSEKKDLETGLRYVSEIINIRKIIEPGLTLNLGENMKVLNQIMMKLAKLKLELGEIDKTDFMKITLSAARNITFAKRCFEDNL